MSPSIRRALFGGAAVLIAAGFAVLPPIQQDQSYHAFADQRVLYGIPNFWNVVSNLPLVAVALYGAVAVQRRTFHQPWERAAHLLVLAGTAAVGLGSAYYHLQPDDARLFWDRLPMAVVFMALTAAIVGSRLLVPLVATGIGSVLWWHLTGDLRAYGLVQFGAVLMVMLALTFGRTAGSGTAMLWASLLLYACAKAAEQFDGGLVSVIAAGGHPLKHLFAAGSILFYTWHTAPRKREPWLSLVPAGAGVLQ